jgi:hypothetical protein
MFDWKMIIAGVLVGGILVSAAALISVWREMTILSNDVTELRKEVENIKVKGNLKGKKGDPGPVGAQGPRGEPGPVGPQGSKGESYPVAEFNKIKSEVFKVRESKNGTPLDVKGGLYWGSWRGETYCPDNHYVCGINQRVEGQQGKGDDTAVNDLQIYCCPF